MSTINASLDLDDVYKLITQENWIQEELVHVSIEMGIDYWSRPKLSSEDTAKFQKILSVYNELSEILKSVECGVESKTRTGSFQIRVITLEKEIKNLQKVTEKWLERVRRIHELAQSKVLQVSQEKQMIVKASLSQVNVINEYLKNEHIYEIKDGFQVYAAFNCEMHEVEGVAIVSPEGSSLKVFDLVTNPKNLVIFNTEQKVVRGAGTRMIERLALDAMVVYKKSSLCLQTLSSSRLFYEQLGFVERDDTEEEDEMELPFDIMERLAKKAMINQKK